MARQMYVSLNPCDWVAFLYNTGSNLHRGLDQAHSISTLHFLLRSNQIDEAKKWYRNWSHHIPASELSHEQRMLLDPEYKLKHEAKVLS